MKGLDYQKQQPTTKQEDLPFEEVPVDSEVSKPETKFVYDVEEEERKERERREDHEDDNPRYGH